MSKSNTIKFSKLKAMNEKNKDRENTSSLKKVLADSKTVSKISFHNGLIGCIYIAFMFIVAFVAIEAAYIGVALMTGYTGCYDLTTVADMLTMYTTLGMVCAIICFFTFKIENCIIRAMKVRIWRKNPETGEIIKGSHYKIVNIEDQITGEAKMIK